MHFLIFLVACVAIYFLPSIIAVQKQKHNTAAILAVNLLLGWSIIGWIVALVWALAESPSPAAYQTTTGPSYTPPPYNPPSYTPPPPAPPPAPAPSPGPAPAPSPIPAARGAYCSHCGAPLKPGDKFCAGCGSSVPAA